MEAIMADKEEENSLGTQDILVTPSFLSLLQSDADIVSNAFRNAFREEISLTMINKELICATASKNTLAKMQLILMDEPVKLYHSSAMKGWLAENSESWLAFTDFLTDDYICAIHTDSDFSKSYIFIAPHHNEHVSKMINNFLPYKESEVIPEDIDSVQSLSVFVYKPFVDYLKNHEEMSAILKSKKQHESLDTPLMMMNLSPESLEILKSKLETIISQSCILTESEAQAFMANKDKLLLDIQKKYQVIGNVFTPKLPMENLVFTQQTRMVCLVSSNPDCLPFDNHIRLQWQFSHNQTEYTVAKEFPNGDKIWKGETWNLPFNQRLLVELPSMQIYGMTVDFESILAECFQMLEVGTENGFKSKITGIYLSSPNPKVQKQFCNGLANVLSSFDQEHPSDSFSCKGIAIIVDTPKIQAKIAKTFSTKGIYEKLAAKDVKNVGHGAIPKTSTKLHEDKLALWVTFSDFSGTPENLTGAVLRLKQKIKMESMPRKTCIIRMHRQKLESLFFFFENEITELVPDLKDQVTKSRGEIVMIVIPQDSQLQIIDAFENMRMEITSTLIDVGIQDGSTLECIVTQCNEYFPNMKCTCIENSKILLESIDVGCNRMVEKEIKSLFSQHLDQPNLNYEEMLTKLQKNCQISPKGIGNIKENDGEFPRNVEENAGNMPEDIKENAGNMLGTVSKNAGNMSGNWPENAGNMPENIKENAGNMIGTVSENAGNMSGTYPENAGNMLENIKENAGNMSEIIPKNTGDMPTNIPESAEELPGNIPEKTESDFQPKQRHSKCPTINVICGDILSDDADAVVCLVFRTMERMSNVQQLILTNAGNIVKNELMACYKEHSHKILLEGKMVSTSAGNLQFKRIFYISCPEYNISNPYNNIPDRIILGMHDLLEASEQQHLRSIAVTICNAESFNIPLEMYLKAILDSITSFVNENYERYLEAIHFVDDLKENCRMAIDILQLCKVPVEPNLKSRTQRRRNIIRQETPIPCPVCFRPVVNPKLFSECQHEYCSQCLKEWLEVIGEMCPLCLNMNSQPPGEMLVKVSEKSLPGFEDFHTFHIIYNIPDGIQQKIHPNPGQRYYGTQRKAYLPANEEGECLIRMLQEAFRKHLIFTVGTSLSSHKSDVVIWNGILHKTQEIGGPSVYGYPDPLYLSHLMAQLMEVGISLESVVSESVSSQIKMTAFN